jgi:hypothetical protein
LRWAARRWLRLPFLTIATDRIIALKLGPAAAILAQALVTELAAVQVMTRMEADDLLGRALIAEGESNIAARK